MPLAIIHYKKGQVPYGVIYRLANNVLPPAIANALSVNDLPEAHLTPLDIDVRVEEWDTRDHQNVDVAVTIDANDYEPRRAKLEEATRGIYEAVREHLTSHSGYVWVRLLPAKFLDWE